MKKVFLSLAALTFITASSLSVASCGGSDDKPNNGGGNNGGGDNGGGDNGGGDNGGGDNGGGDNGGGDNGGGEVPEPSPNSVGKIVYNGQEYNLNSTYFSVYGQDNSASAYNYVVNGDTIKVSVWNLISWEGNANQIQSSLNYVSTRIAVPLAETAQGLSLVYPQDAEVVYVIGSGLYAGNAETPVDLGAFVSGEVNITELVNPQQGQPKGSIKYTTSITRANGSYTVTFDGDYYGDMVVAQPQGRNSISNLQDTKVPVNFNSRLTKTNGKVLLRK